MFLKSEITTYPSESLFLWDISESEEELKTLYCADGSSLPAIQDSARLKHFLASRMLVRRVFPGQVLNKDVFGKPYIRGFSGDISLSHSGDLAGLLVSTKGSCGLDLEVPGDRILRIAGRFCAPEELDFQEVATFRESLHIIWGAKECMYKAYGRKGIDFRTQLRVSPFVVSDKGTIHGTLTLAEVVQHFRISYHYYKSYILLWTEAESG